MITRYTLPYLADSCDYFSRIRHLELPVLLDSCQPASPSGRFDIMTAAPSKVLTLNVDDFSACPFSELESLYLSANSQCCPEDDIPFCGGVIASFSYDLGRSLESLEHTSTNDMHYPDLQAGLYHWALITDHQSQTTTLVFQSNVPNNEQEEILGFVQQPPTHKSQATFQIDGPFQANVNVDQYQQKLQAIDDYIHAGDCYQVNFAQRFSSQYTGDPWLAYKALRQAAPTPFAAYIESPYGHLLSLSPERFIKVDERHVSTKPIKGTRPRSNNKAQDKALQNELLNSTKDRAENLMIVDLLRNDLSKGCQLGSVQVPKLFDLESYANVHHLVSTVTGDLSSNTSPLMLFKHCFPGGSITGAPKIRAMQIIEELEPHRRNIYCGSIGYVSFCGKLDSSITIRTLLCENNQIYCWGGGGIVADSDIDSEYVESCTKVNNLLSTLEATLDHPLHT